MRLSTEYLLTQETVQTEHLCGEQRSAEQVIGQVIGIKFFKSCSMKASMARKHGNGFYDIFNK